MDQETARLLAMELQLENSSRWDTVYFHGKTMWPFLRERDELVVAPTTFEDLRPGDVVTYRHGDKFPTRRVFGRQQRKGRLLLKSDGLALRTTFWVDRRDVLGKVVARRRGESWVTNADLAWRAVTWRMLVRHRLYRRWTRVMRRLRGAPTASRDS